MKHLVTPLLFLTIFADAWFWWHYDTISVDTYFTGETIVYLLWVAAFFIYVKFPPSEFEKRIITLILLGWLPFCVNAIYRQMTGHGSEKSPWDLYSGLISLAIVAVQILVWWRKNKRA